MKILQKELQKYVINMKIIVVEDDNLVSKYFLNFINDGLDL